MITILSHEIPNLFWEVDALVLQNEISSFFGLVASFVPSFHYYERVSYLNTTPNSKR